MVYRLCVSLAITTGVVVLGGCDDGNERAPDASSTTSAVDSTRILPDSGPYGHRLTCDLFYEIDARPKDQVDTGLGLLASRTGDRDLAEAIEGFLEGADPERHRDRIDELCDCRGGICSWCRGSAAGVQLTAMVQHVVWPGGTAATS